MEQELKNNFGVHLCLKNGLMQKKMKQKIRREDVWYLRIHCLSIVTSLTQDHTHTL